MANNPNQKKNWAGCGGGMCGLGELGRGGGLVVSEFFDKESNFFLGGGGEGRIFLIN